MGDLGSKAAELIRDSKELARLLALEKQRKKLPANSLIFIGMHNVAQHWWCTQQAVLKSRANEIEFFGAYLCDRFVYVDRLGLVSKKPLKKEECLNIGNEITLSDVEKMCTQDRQNSFDVDKCQARHMAIDKFDTQGKPIRFINPDMPDAEKKLLIQEAQGNDIRVADIEEAPTVRGDFLHESRAERYPTIRWNFPWGKYIVIGIPDGLTREFVYEYKTTRNRFMLNFAKPVALAQADLYGYFFKRPKKRVQIEILEENKVETYEDLVNTARAEQTLSAFARVDGGEASRPPKPWKCRNCEFRGVCPISQIEG